MMLRTRWCVGTGDPQWKLSPGVDVNDSPCAERPVKPDAHRPVDVLARTQRKFGLGINRDKHPDVDLVLALVHHELANAVLVPG
jgi:hypothetical protein